MNKKEIAEILEEMAVLLELKDENPFKIRAFQNGARAVEGIEEDIEKLSEQKKLTEIPGIGNHLATLITELIQIGFSKDHQQLKKSFPEGVLKMLSIQGLGPKKVKVLYQKLKLKTVEELEEACKQHKLLKVEGFGEKTEINILKGIEYLKKSKDSHLFPEALDEAHAYMDYLSKSSHTQRISIAGSLRRHKETIRDIDLLISSSNPKEVIKTFVSYPLVNRILAEGETKSAVILKSRINVDLRVVTDTEYPFALHYFTGSKEHNTHLRSIAKDKGLKLNEYGLFKGKKSLPCKTEEDLFKTLGLSYIEPELREDVGEIDAAQKNKLPKKLVEFKDIRGAFHNHTTYSDGAATLEQMVHKAQSMGFEFIGISDHSKAAYYANGLKPDRVKKQWKEIDVLNSKLKNFKILKGTEVDILPDGTLDFEDELLAQFDFVIASVHSKFNMTEKDMTKRITTALKNKYVTMVGHPTGHLFFMREGYPVNLHTLVDVAKDYGKSVELNANPHRFDVDWRMCKYAKSKSVPISINPDAHKTEGIEDIQYGVGIARKGWLEPKDVLTTWPLKDIMKFLKSYR
ncbi:MAG: histidinol-phosphatase [Deltaproteobacteria bacterium GWA2_38_16]|nr:MAG: histidinol-phosphatase [Deltaproteobacteria bacterium GWA2_38_16]OGQ02456.1 MAG: histidinol-phosphatase [Deltaproteobacteria bacterium RIFCSPHIGHO2_02_FULL_38_15]OGQ34874.1 MAG: histidinol-phosphatase [Deltaproteobacteria bacterium RIFCSPLOWO2_01_FULL_38_9]HBQ21090.1 DNA polymerase/3'-5' exonuclease PolX [Deltaproteobacteria bacterium]